MGEGGLPDGAEAQAGGAAVTRSEGSVGGGVPLSSFILLTLRVLLGGIFCWAAYNKMHVPQAFLEAIQAFKIVHSERVEVLSTYALPMVEMLAGIALVLGFWTREAAVLIGLLLLVFIAAIVSAIARHMDNIPCSCFGYWHLYCEGVVGWCKVGENTVLTTIAAILVVTGGGRLAVCRPAAGPDAAYA